MQRLLGSACLCAALGCQSFVGDYAADLDQSSALCAVDSTLSFNLELDSEEAKDSLESYYATANPALVENLSEVAEKFANGERHGGVTYLRGAAGVGKSFVTGNIMAGFSADQQCLVEFGDLFAASVEERGFDVKLRPDLATTNGAHVFNELLALSDPAEVDVDVLLGGTVCSNDGVLRPLIVLDGIDEIHDASARAILETVDDYILHRDQDAVPFIHFLISGRPEGFASWLSASERKLANTEIETQLDLQGGRYVTAGDLAFRAASYFEFAPVAAEFTDEDVAEYTASFIDALRRHPFLRYTTSNLAFGNFVIDQTAPGLDASEHALKTRLFNDILQRDVDTHGRPGASSEFDGAYRRALEDIAAKYIDVDEQGRFTVSSDDTVDCFGDDGESLGHLRVRDVLNRSGVAVLTDPRVTTTRYRFDPFWVHAHLIETRNERLHSGYEYQTCE